MNINGGEARLVLHRPVWKKWGTAKTAVVSLCPASFNLSFSERMPRKLAHCNESLKEQPVLPEQVAVRFPELLQRLP